MTSLIVLPSIQSGIYRISSLSPELYLELQSDNSLRATKLNKSSDSQKVGQILYLSSIPIACGFLCSKYSNHFYVFVVGDQPR